MSFSFLNFVSQSPIHSLTSLVQLYKKEENPNVSSASIFDSFPCFSLDDQLLRFFSHYYQGYPEKKSTTPYLLQLDIKNFLNIEAFYQDKLVSAVVNFLNKKRELGAPLQRSFKIQKLLRFIDADEVEWIGSSLTEVLTPYLEELCIQHLLPKDLKNQEIFKHLLAAWFLQPSSQKKLTKKGADYDLRLIKQNDPKEQTNQALNFFKSKIPAYAFSPLHIFANTLKESGLLNKRWAAQAQATNYYAMVAFNLINDKPLEIICVNRLTHGRLSLEKTHLSNTNCLRLLLHKAWSSYPSLEISAAPFCAQDFLIYLLGNVWNVSDDQTLDSATWIRYLRDDGRSTQPHLMRRMIQAIKKVYPTEKGFHQHICDKLEKEMIKNTLSSLDSFELLFRALQSLYECKSLKPQDFSKLCDYFRLKRNWDLNRDPLTPSLVHTIFQLLFVRQVPFAQVSAALTLICTYCFPESLSHRDQQLAFHLVINQNQHEWKCWLAFDLEHAMTTLTDLDLFFEMYQALSFSFVSDSFLLFPYLDGQKEKLIPLALNWINQTSPQAILLGWQLYILAKNQSLTTQECYQLFQALPLLFPYLNKQWLSGLLAGLKASHLQQEVVILTHLCKQFPIQSIQQLEIAWIEQLLQTRVSHWISLAYQQLLHTLPLNKPLIFRFFDLFCSYYPVRAAQLLKNLLKTNLLTLDEKLNKLQVLQIGYESFFCFSSPSYSALKELNDLTFYLIHRWEMRLGTQYSELFYTILLKFYQSNFSKLLNDTLLLEVTQKKVLSPEHLQALWVLRLNQLLSTHYVKAAFLWHQAHKKNLLGEIIKQFPQAWESIFQQLLRSSHLLTHYPLKWEMLEQTLRISSSTTNTLLILKFLHHLLIEKQIPPPIIQKWMEKKQKTILITLKEQQLPVEAQTFLNALVTFQLNCQPPVGVIAWLFNSLDQINEAHWLKLVSQQLQEETFLALSALDPLVHWTLIERLHNKLPSTLVNHCLTHLLQTTENSLALKIIQWIIQLNQQGKFSEALQLLHLFVLENKQLDEKAWLSCWLTIAQTQSIELITCLWSAFLKSKPLTHFQSVDGALAWIHALQAFDLIKDKMSHPNFFDSLVAIQWPSTHQWITQKFLFYRLVISYGFYFIQNPSIEDEDYEKICKWIDELKNQAIREGMDLTDSLSHPIYQEFIINVQLELSIYYSKIPMISCLVQAVESLKLFCLMVLEIPSNQQGILVPNFSYHIKSFISNFSTFFKAHLESSDLLISHLGLCELIAPCHVLSFEDYIDFLKLNKFSDQLNHQSNSSDYLSREFTLLKNLKDYPDFKTSLFFHLFRIYVKKIEDSKDALLIEQVIRFLYEFSDALHLPREEHQKILITTYQIYLLSHPPLKNVLSLYPIIFSHFLDHSESLIKCLTYHINYMFPYLEVLTKQQELETDINLKSQILLNHKLYLSFPLICIINFYATSSHAVTLNQEKTLILYRHHFLSYCKKLGYSKIDIAILLIHLVQLGMEKKLSLACLTPILKDLIYHLNYNEGMNGRDKTHRISEDVNCFQSIGDLLDEVTRFYQVNSEDFTEFNETKCFFDSVFSNIYEETGQTIPVNYLVNSANYLMKVGTLLASTDLVQFLYFFKAHELLDHPHFLIIYTKLIQVASTHYVDELIKGETSLLEVIHNLYKGPFLTPLPSNQLKPLKNLIHLQLETIISTLLNLSKNNKINLVKHYLPLCFKIFHCDLELFITEENQVNLNYKNNKLKEYIQQLKCLIPVIIKVEASSQLDEEFNSHLLPFAPQVYKTSVKWLRFIKFLSCKFTSSQQSATLFKLIKKWIESIETSSLKTLKGKVSDLLIVSLRELTFEKIYSAASPESTPPLIIHVNDITQHEVCWLNMHHFQHNLVFNQTHHKQVNYQTGKILSFSSDKETCIYYFDQLYEKSRKKSSPLQQMHLDMLHFFFFQMRVKQQPNYYDKYVTSLLTLLPQTGIVGLHCLGFVATVFNLPFISDSKAVINYPKIYEKNQKEFIPLFLKMTAQLMQENLLSQNAAIQTFLSSNIILILHQLTLAYPDVSNQPGWKAVITQLKNLPDLIEKLEIESTPLIN
jgi:hypothetical protein